MEFPLISIVIPVYNGSNYLAEAIDSALSQTYPNFEIIVVNDGSRDNGATAAVAKSYGDKIRYFEKENGGSSSAINYGISQMRGEWFSWLSHDDLYVPQKLQREMEFLNSLNLSSEELRTHMVFSASQLIDASGRIIRDTSIKEAQKMCSTVESITGNEYLVAQPRKFNFHGCSCLIHKCVFEIAGVLDEKLRILNDVDWWFRIYTYGIRMHYVPKVLVKGRVHAAQVGRSVGYSSNNSESDMLWEKRLTWLVENHNQCAELFVLFGRDAYMSLRFNEGKAAFNHAARIEPQRRTALCSMALCYRAYALCRRCAKNIYVRIKLRK